MGVSVPLALVAIAFGSVHADSLRHRALGIDVQSAVLDDTTQYWLTVTNEGDSSAVVTVQLLVGQSRRGLSSADTVGAGDRTIRHVLSLPRKDAAAGAMLVHAISGGRQSSWFFPLREDDRGTSSRGLWSSVLAVLATLAGIVVGHVLTAQRDQANAKREWRRILLSRYEPEYRRFLMAWSRSRSLEILRAQFGLLRANALVSSAVLSSYNEAVSSAEGDLVAPAAVEALAEAIEAEVLGA